jgi:NifB/MoaA-like Fe-S oxidoreductase
MEKFNEKYQGLNDRQKNLLREYINNVSNSATLRKCAVSECNVLITEIKSKLNYVQDKIVKIKLSEVVSQLEKIKTTQVIKENHMTALLIALEITKTLDNLKS